ncbi:hypothetical protein [Streptomyces sp. AK02-04a]|uniref:hypothetical protein n=1 Tax=Streptomyces sp. AK02-04a TaxID=3028649 RepID=UPI0029BD7666|nr:hypothetical protein [Streptomyces sp. AK02-04a]MDX3762089.1 hypothetical protein [Streptomyces sp. AK02-04a]
METRQFGHRARLALSPVLAAKAADQAHAARTVCNLPHAWWQMVPKEKRTNANANADPAIRRARRDVDFLAVHLAQAAQAVLRTYCQAWKNRWAGRTDAPNFKARFRSTLTVERERRRNRGGRPVR